MPTPDSRKIISLAALSEFKTKQDTYNASKFVPYQNATGPVNLGEYAIYASEFSDSALGAGGSRIYFYEGDINISGAAGVAVTTGNGNFTYNGVEVATKADISRAYKTRGSATVSELETLAAGSTLENGDVYNVSNNGTLDNVGPSHAQDVRVRAGDNVVWIVPASPATPYWDILAGTTDFVTNSALSDALAGYLPLSAGSRKVLTDTLYVKPDIGAVGASIIANGGVLSLLGETGVSISAGATANTNMRLKAHNFVFSDVFATSSQTTIVARSDSGQANTLNLPTEDGTLVVGEYATTGTNGDIAALFN